MFYDISYMENKIYDIIILWAGPAWLFCASKILRKYSILMLDKNSSPAQKLLLSAKWRWNITNLNINPANDYISDDLNFVTSSFDKFWVNNFLEFLETEWIEIQEENNWRILLKSGKIKEFHKKLVDNVMNNWIEIKHNSEFISIDKLDDIFKIETNWWIYFTKKFIVAAWWPSFPKLWATSVVLNIAHHFNLWFTPFYPALVGFETKQDFSSLSGSSIIWKLSLLKWDKIIYEETWSILFTHRWISGPAVFNASIFVWEMFNLWKTKYQIKIIVSSKDITKRLLKFLWFHSNKLMKYVISSDIKNVRWLDEAKVCWWWIMTKNLSLDFECKNVPWLYFIWECVNVTWKTWWFNLQRCRTSAAICANWINNL